MGPFSAVRFLNTSLRYAASADPTGWYMPNCVDDVRDIIKEYGDELCANLDRVDVEAARAVASRYDVLREPLLGLGILQVNVEERRPGEGVGLLEK